MTFSKFTICRLRRLLGGALICMATVVQSPAWAHADLDAARRHWARDAVPAVAPSRPQLAYHMSTGKKRSAKETDQSEGTEDGSAEEGESKTETSPSDSDDATDGSTSGTSTRPSAPRRKAIKRKAATRKAAVRKSSSRKKATRKKAVRKKIRSRRKTATKAKKKSSRLAPTIGETKTHVASGPEGVRRRKSSIALVRRASGDGSGSALVLVPLRPVPPGRRICVRLDLGLAAPCRF